MKTFLLAGASAIALAAFTQTGSAYPQVHAAADIGIAADAAGDALVIAKRGRGRGGDDAPDAPDAPDEPDAPDTPGDDDGTADQGSGDVIAAILGGDAAMFVAGEDQDAVVIARKGRSGTGVRGRDRDRDDDHRGRGRGRGADDNGNDDDQSGSGRSKPRVPGGSGCDDPGDVAEHAACR